MKPTSPIPESVRPLLKSIRATILATAFATASIQTPAPAGEPASPDSARFAPSLAVVEYELQYDKSDAPAGGVGAERCPNCGQFHGNDLLNYLKEERPVETAGYVLAPDLVLAKDPQMNPRFIKSIVVRQNGQASNARIESHAQFHNAVVLKLEAPLKKAVPIQFGKSPGKPARMTDLNWQLGRWCVVESGFNGSVVIPPDGPPYLATTSGGIGLSANGKAMGIIVDNCLPPGDQWQGSPLEWTRMGRETLEKHLAALKGMTDQGIVRVHLGFRSPKATQDGAGMFRSRYSGFRGGAKLGPETTEADVTGLMLPGGRVLVLANLDPKLTTRLEKILLHLPGGQETPARFEATLKDFGAFTATLEGAQADGVKISTADIASSRNQLLLRADIKMQGESREEHFETARLSTFNYGAKHRIYPDLDGMTPEGAFIFSIDRQLLAFSLEPRAQVTGERAGFDSDTPILIPAGYVLAAVNQLPGSADLSNVPVPEAEENRLAWLGTELQPLDQDLARANGVSSQTRDGEIGAIVTYVHPGSPAAKAGIQAGNVLLRLKVANRPLPLEVQIEEDTIRTQAFPWERLDEIPAQYFDRIPSPWPPVENNFIRALTDLGFGTKFMLEYFADGKVQSKEMEVSPCPLHYESAPRYQSKALGITVRDMTYEVRRHLQRKADEPGVVTSKVDAGGRAGVAGVRPYELITHINEQPVNNVKDFERLIAAGGELKLSVKRMAKGRIVTVKIDSN